MMMMIVEAYFYWVCPCVGKTASIIQVYTVLTCLRAMKYTTEYDLGSHSLCYYCEHRRVLYLLHIQYHSTWVGRLSASECCSRVKIAEIPNRGGLQYDNGLYRYDTVIL